MRNRSNSRSSDVFYVIEDGVPIPSRRGLGQTGMVPTLRRLEVGQSVFIPDKTPTHLGAVYKLARPFRYTSRSVEGGVRVWRIE